MCGGDVIKPNACIHSRFPPLQRTQERGTRVLLMPARSKAWATRLYVWNDRYAELDDAGLVRRHRGKAAEADWGDPGIGSPAATRRTVVGAEADGELERKVGQQGLELDFFGEGLRQIRVEMCELSGVSRAGFYRHWEASASRQADTALRDAIQQGIVEMRFYD
jgi:hypothetical protein